MDRVHALAAARRYDVAAPTAPYTPTSPAPKPPAPPPLTARQTECLAKLRAWRCRDRVDAALILLGWAATRPGADVLPPMYEALAAGATIGEVSAVLRDHWNADDQSPG
ncbi:methylmalonyl-CoA mutase family protein [Streptomyces fradiae]|uniref:methylmalonyl-CoA mutase family protein n=1 Tax=Streptomyces fradiae TaxID=1906 RepID=UPI003512E785